MDRREALEQLKKEYRDIKIPPEGKDKMQIVIERAKADKIKFSSRKAVYKWAVAAVAVLIILILPNTSATMSYAMQQIPVVGELFRVVTFREYNYEDNHNSLSVKIPKIEGKNNLYTDSREEINAEIENYTNQLIVQFKRDMTESGYNGLDVSYKTITNTEDWFTLEFNVTETKASGYEIRRYYHIDKTTGKIVRLKDLFQEGSDYVTIISDEIKRQMTEQMSKGEGTYFIEDNGVCDAFKYIKTNQGFYFNKDKNLVIVFDEYDVGPGSMGSPEFIIPNGVIKAILD